MLKALQRLFIGSIIIVLVAAIGYLLSDLNHRRFRTLQIGDLWIVEQGRFFPIGFATYHPTTEALAQAYAPIPIPPNEVLLEPSVFEDRAELDRGLFNRLAQWARQRLNASDEATNLLAAQYVRRAELLPGISEDQRVQLRSLRADASYEQGMHLSANLQEQLRRAQAALQLALDLGTTHNVQARQELQNIEKKLQLLNGDPSAQTPPTTHKNIAPGEQAL